MIFFDFESNNYYKKATQGNGKMRIYEVINDKGYQERFYNLTDAKKAMKTHDARGYITKVYSNGDWVDCGEIRLKASNKAFVANSRMSKAGY